MFGPGQPVATRSARARSTVSGRGPKPRWVRRRRQSLQRYVVLGGNVPLDVLAKNVDEYIRTAKTA